MKLKSIHTRSIKVSLINLWKILMIFLLFIVITLQIWSLNVENNEFVFLRKKLLEFKIESFHCNKTVEINLKPYYQRKYWQTLNTSNGYFMLLNAYYDVRTNDHMVRIISYINRESPNVEVYCQFWYDDKKIPFIVPIYEYRLMWFPTWTTSPKGFTPFLIACKNPLKDFVPSSVSITEEYCEKASNNLKVIYNKIEEKRKSFGVCVKRMIFDDDHSKELTEWIEIISILGAEKLFMYTIKMHPKMMKVLKFYEKIGRVEIETITDPRIDETGDGLQGLQNELASINDCFYKHMYEFDFLAIIDIDELIVPVRPEDKSWKDLMHRQLTKSKSASSYSSYNSFFLLDNIHSKDIEPEIPEDMFFLKHVNRAQNFSERGVRMKSFFNTSEVLVAHNHFPIWCLSSLDGSCVFEDFNKTDAKLHHYRKGCDDDIEGPVKCNDYKQNTVKDTTLWKWKNEIINNVRHSQRVIKEFNDNK